MGPYFGSKFSRKGTLERHKKVWHAYIQMNNPKAICPTNFFKVGAIITCTWVAGLIKKCLPSGGGTYFWNSPKLFFSGYYQQVGLSRSLRQNPSIQGKSIYKVYKYIHPAGDVTGVFDVPGNMTVKIMDAENRWRGYRDINRLN